MTARTDRRLSNEEATTFATAESLAVWRKRLVDRLLTPERAPESAEKLEAASEALIDAERAVRALLRALEAER